MAKKQLTMCSTLSATRAMKTKTIMQHHTQNKKRDNIKYWQICGIVGTILPSGGRTSWYNQFENSLAIFTKAQRLHSL